MLYISWLSYEPNIGWGFGVGTKGFGAKGLGPGLDNLLFMLKAFKDPNLEIAS